MASLSRRLGVEVEREILWENFGEELVFQDILKKERKMLNAFGKEVSILAVYTGTADGKEAEIWWGEES